MQLNPVESTMIARVGYEPGPLILRVVMKDGTAYDVDDCSPEAFIAFMAARSKGSYWHRVFAGRATKSQPGEGKESAERDQSTGKGGGEHQTPPIKLREPVRPLDTFEPDNCCGFPLSKALCSGALSDVDSWTCPKCGCEWTPRMVGGVRHWEPCPVTMLIRRHP